MKLLIVGAGGQGRNCLEIARSMKEFDEIAFLDDAKKGDVISGCKVEGTFSEMAVLKNKYDSIFIALGDNKLRKSLARQAFGIGYNIATLISPKSYVSEYAIIGAGTAVFPCAVVEADARVKSGCIIAANATINHDALVEEYSIVFPNSVIRPCAVVGSQSTIGSGCVVVINTDVRKNSEVSDGKVLSSDYDYSFEAGM